MHNMADCNEILEVNKEVFSDKEVGVESIEGACVLTFKDK